MLKHLAKALIPLFLLSSCGQPEVESPCFDYSCAQGFVCRHGCTEVLCTGPSDCRPTEVCAQFHDSSPSVCTALECGAGLTCKLSQDCINGLCRSQSSGVDAMDGEGASPETLAIDAPL